MAFATREQWNELVSGIVEVCRSGVYDAAEIAQQLNESGRFSHFVRKISQDDVANQLVRLRQSGQLARLLKEPLVQSFKSGGLSRRVYEAAKEDIERDDRAVRYDSETGRFRI